MKQYKPIKPTKREYRFGLGQAVPMVMYVSQTENGGAILQQPTL